MIEEIFEMIMKEARTRKGETLELQTLLVFLEVQEKVFAAIKTLRTQNTKGARIKYVGDNP